MSAPRPEEILWEPSAAMRERAGMTRYLRWLESRHGLTFEDYDDLWRWSVADIEAFWATVWDFGGVISGSPYEAVLASDQMPGARWFPGARLNFAEHAFARAHSQQPAVVARDERGGRREISWAELERSVASVAAALRRLGVQRGDRVAAYIQNVPETVVAMLACASVGAIWCSCAPDFGTESVIARFAQVEPKVLIASDGYMFGGREHDRSQELVAILDALASVEHSIVVPCLRDRPPAGTFDFRELAGATCAPSYEQLPFDHPLWVLFSSGTTGPPKGIVHGHGGVVLESLKALPLHFDVHAGDRFFFHSSTSWVVWNLHLTGLLAGATLVLYDGSPVYPEVDALWRVAAETRATMLGVGSAYVTGCERAAARPGEGHDLSALQHVLATGSPLPSSAARWVYEHAKRDVWLTSPSGGTEVCGAFVGGNPLLPVYAGEIQCRCLGVAVEAVSDEGRALIDAVGELVITKPMPSMPVCLWGDPDGSLYRQAYFERFPGVWCHGDWVTVTSRGTAIVHGRSDATLNRAGVRMGSGDVYEAVESVSGVADSLIVGVERENGEYWMPLFVVPDAGAELDDELRSRIMEAIRAKASPRHVPDEIVAVSKVPRTITGKKLEVPVKRLLMGLPESEAVNPGVLADPSAIDEYVAIASGQLGRATPAAT